MAFGGRAQFAIALLLPLSLWVSGCSGAKAQATIADPYLQPVGFTETTGTVKGYVVDEEFQPLRDAVVGFIDPYQATRTNEFGEFEIGLLDPGKRNLYVIHMGHQSAGKRIEIFTQQETIVTFVLGVLPIEEPWIEVILRAGHFERAFTIDPLSYSFNSTQMSWGLADKHEALQAIQVEIEWTQAQSLAGGLRADLGLLNERDGHLLTADGPSPLVGTADRAMFDAAVKKSDGACLKDPCRFRLEVRPSTHTTNLAVDAGVMLEQPFEVVVSNVYRMPLPEGYTALL